MSQKIYLDDCAAARDLVVLLQAAGHQVVIPRQVGLDGRDDDVHFRYAAGQGLVLLTRNPDDFRELHEADANHAGILAIYQDNDPDRDMTNADIAPRACQPGGRGHRAARLLPRLECLALLTAPCPQGAGSQKRGGRKRYQESLWIYKGSLYLFTVRPLHPAG